MILFMLLKKVHHRDDLWRKMQDIEARSKNSSRLFDNRGCVLLQEEKERKRIVKVNANKVFNSISYYDFLLYLKELPRV